MNSCILVLDSCLKDSIDLGLTDLEIRRIETHVNVPAKGPVDLPTIKHCIQVGEGEVQIFVEVYILPFSPDWLSLEFINSTFHFQLDASGLLKSHLD